MINTFLRPKSPIMKIAMMGPRAGGKTTILTSVFNETSTSIATTKLNLIAYGDTKKELQDYKKDYSNLRNQFDEKVKELQSLRKQMENIKKDETTNPYSKKLTDSTLLFCSKIATFIEQVGGYVWLTDEINKIPELEREGYIKSVHAIKAWADTMEYNINNKVKEIN